MKWASVNQAGAVVNTGYVPDTFTLENFAGFTDTVILNVADDVDSATHYYNHATSAFVAMPARPSAEHYFDYATKAWVRDTVAAELKVRAQRGRLLAQSDWTQLPDVPLTTKEEWAVYRQALRDITEQSGFPTAVVWPTAPG